MKKVVYFFYGGFIGVIIGGLLGLLLAPTKGQETRSYLKQEMKEISSQFTQAVEERRKQLEQEIQTFSNK